MKILCVGDSLGLPRPGVLYEDTWFYKLQGYFKEYHFISKQVRGLSTEALVCGGVTQAGVEGADFLEFYAPDVVIMQVGIVDCAPRYFHSNSLLFKIIKKMPSFIEDFFWKLYKRFKKRSAKNASVESTRFLHNVEKYIRRCECLDVKKIIIIMIGKPSQEAYINNPEFDISINKYNSIIENIAKKKSFIITINPFFEGNKALYVDSYHPNELGNLLVFNQLKNILCQN